RQLQAGDILTDPGRLVDLTDAIGEATKVDDEFSATELVGLMLSLRGLDATNVTFLTVPTDGTAWAGSASIVVYDREDADDLWAAVRSNDVASFLTTHGELVTAESVH
ncbi:MAG TPA: hypothetical protein VFI46_09050, partial [Jiangellaceae bacterium]|nr:hypothetical protein [Jiangellaceae bacterium]